MLSLFATKFIKAWRAGPLSPAPAVPLLTALSARYPTDAHACAVYWMRDGAALSARVAKDALGSARALGLEPRASTLWAEWDDPQAHATGQPASAEWRATLGEKWAALPIAPTAYLYHTRGGARAVWQIDPLGPEAYESASRRLAAYLQGHGLDCDPLHDWSRLWRLPFVRRSGKDEQGPLFGPDRPGALDLSLLPVIGDLRPEKKPLDTGPITEARNVSLARVAGRARRAGLGEAAILGALRAENETRCVPPLEDHELAHIAKQIGRKPSPLDGPPEPDAAPAPAQAGPDVNKKDSDPDSAPQPQSAPVVKPLNEKAVSTDPLSRGSEAELAGRLLDTVGAFGPVVADRGALWLCDQGLWTEVPRAEMSKILQTWDGQRVTCGLAPDGTPKTRPLYVSSALVAGVASLASDRVASPGFFDAAAEGLAFRTDFVRVVDGAIKVEPLAPEHRQMHALPAPWGQDAPLCPSWLRTLGETWAGCPDAAERILALREWLGAALLGLATRYARGLILVGEGANGKSVILDVMAAIFPAGSVAHVAPQDWDQEYRRAMLATARINTVNDLPSAEILQSGPVKAVLTGDGIDGRRIRQDPFSFRPRAGHAFGANDLPQVRDLSAGFWRRWLVLRCPNTVPEAKRRPRLADEISAAEGPAIARWAVEAVPALAARRDYSLSREMRAELSEWQAESNSAAEWAGQAKAGPKGWIPAARLYQEHALWCRENGRSVRSSQRFFKDLVRMGVARRRTAGGIEYAPAGVPDESPPAPAVTDGARKMPTLTLVSSFGGK